jgi:dTDP-4-dehydrorhamnose reductase
MGLSPHLSSQTTEQSGAMAKRPYYSVLDNKKIRDIGIDDMKHWKYALNDYLVEKHDAAHITEGE